MTITVNSRVTDGERLRVSVAGRECADPVVVPHVTHDTNDDHTVINCTVPVGEIATKTGPVIVEYVSSNRTFGSTRDFRFVLPDVRNLSPCAGPIKGGTLLNISGVFFDLAKSVRVTIDPHMECTIVRRENHSVSCRIPKFPMLVKRNSNIPCRVQLTFDDGAYETIAYHPFEYVTEPTIQEQKMQHFEGIISGGNRLSVKGTGFKNFYLSQTNKNELKNPKVYVEFDDKRYYGNCTVINDKDMDCLTPDVMEMWLGENSSLNTIMPLGFEMPFFGETLYKSLHSTNYRVHPNPVYDNFEANDTAVIINGAFLFTGYRAGDLTVHLPNSSEVACDVTTVNNRFIICDHPRSRSVVNAHKLLVSVGGTFNNTVVSLYSPKISYDDPDIHSAVISSFTMIVVFVILILGLLFIVKTILSNSQQQTEKRFIEELRNITAGFDA